MPSHPLQLPAQVSPPVLVDGHEESEVIQILDSQRQHGQLQYMGEIVSWTNQRLVKASSCNDSLSVSASSWHWAANGRISSPQQNCNFWASFLPFRSRSLVFILTYSKSKPFQMLKVKFSSSFNLEKKTVLQLSENWGNTLL